MNFTKGEVLGFLYLLCTVLCVVDVLFGGVFARYILAFLVATVLTDVFWIEDKK